MSQGEYQHKWKHKNSILIGEGCIVSHSSERPGDMENGLLLGVGEGSVPFSSFSSGGDISARLSLGILNWASAWALVGSVGRWGVTICNVLWT